MADLFSGRADSVSSPARRAVTVVPNDSQPLAEIPKALFVGTGGTIALRGVGGGADQLFKNVPNGSVLPFRAEFVRATGTTATDILALY
jgi:outer membrane receptor protein involved in Fe transport